MPGDRYHHKATTNKKRSQNKKKHYQNAKVRRREAEAVEQERLLTESLFGTTTAVIQPPRTKRFKDDDNVEFAFEIDRVGDSTQLPKADDDDDRSGSRSHLKEDDDSDDDEQRKQQQDAACGGPAWVDPDDNIVDMNTTNSRLRKLRTSKNENAVRGSELEERLRERFVSTTAVTARTDWADLKHQQQKAADDDNGEHQEDLIKNASVPLIQTTTTATGTTKLAPNLINMKRCPDLNLTDPCRSVVQAVHFHPGSSHDKPLVLTAGLDKTLRFFQINDDDETSTKIHGIHFPKMPIYSASFLGETGKVVVSGRRSFFYIYDSVGGKLETIPKIVGRTKREKSLETCVASTNTLAFGGNDGYIILFDANRQTWRGDLKINGSVRALAFSTGDNGDSEEIWASGSDGDVYRWDVRSNKCLERFSNQDGSITCSLSASARHLAVGAESGVVNLYDNHNHGNTTRNPIKSIMNLPTNADLVRFNPQGQVLAFSSRRERNALKLLHVPSATVFSNWPTSKTPLGYVWSMDFSPASKYLAIGNDKGKCLLYKMMHYYDQNNDDDDV